MAQAKDNNKVLTAGDALKAVARSTAGNKPVDFADAAAIQAAEEIMCTATGTLATKALQAAETNVKPAEERSSGVATVRLRDVLTTMGGDEDDDALQGGDGKAVTREDAEKVAAAARSSAGKRGAGTGKAVVEAVTAAADIF